MEQAQFLHRLQAEATLQAKLHNQRWLPTQLDPLTTLVGKYSWQTILILALTTSVAIHVFGKL